MALAPSALPASYWYTAELSKKKPGGVLMAFTELVDGAWVLRSTATQHQDLVELVSGRWPGINVETAFYTISPRIVWCGLCIHPGCALHLHLRSNAELEPPEQTCAKCNRTLSEVVTAVQHFKLQNPTHWQSLMAAGRNEAVCVDEFLIGSWVRRNGAQVCDGVRLRSAVQAPEEELSAITAEIQAVNTVYYPRLNGFVYSLDAGTREHGLAAQEYLDALMHIVNGAPARLRGAVRDLTHKHRFNTMLLGWG